MKILYLSCHAILEYDELKIFEELRLDYFSLGSYVNPQKPVDSIRPALKHMPDEWFITHAPARDDLPQEFIDKFDVIIVMHVKEWIIGNWEKLKKKTVIWRTIGQSTPEYERALFPLRQEGLKVVRYSKREVFIQDNIGCDAIIPFYKDPEEFKDWNGMQREAIVFHQDMKHRGEYCGYENFLQIVSGFPAHIYGPNNQNSGELNGGFLTYEEMRQKMRDARVYIYTGTQPASYTLNFIEALMTGIPVVCLGPNLWNTLNLAGDVYEIPDIIQNGINGFFSDDINQLRDYVGVLLDSPETAKRIGDMGRQTAIDLFGKEAIKAKWKSFLTQILDKH